MQSADWLEQRIHISREKACSPLAAALAAGAVAPGSSASGALVTLLLSAPSASTDPKTAQKRDMRVLRASKFRLSAASTHCEDACSTVLSAATSTEDALSVSEIIGPSMCSESVPSSVTPSVSEIAGPTTSSASGPSSVSGPSTIHVRTRFLTREEIDANTKRRDAVRAELEATPATQKKFQLMEPALAPAVTNDGEHFSLVQMNLFNIVLNFTVCKQCLKGGMTVRESTKLGLATKLEVVCSSCGTIDKLWTSPRKQDSQAFDVNVHAIAAMKQIGKGQTALNDFWAAMNVSYRVGAESWCRHRAAEAKGEPQPRHKHNLPDYVAEAMLPIYQRLSHESLLQRCLGAKTQNASEPFHSKQVCMKRCCVTTPAAAKQRKLYLTPLDFDQGT
ncbi:hypothetical protein HPB52_008997 [Rhipicephalus sanguineus]|uniref:Mutator-like transposase domain-containing protein n=1 Tax=Rhipicephalus sanguineus TaxID=34632 RepID=A0A9D4PLR0_RHISA|nr:hypothetical protein HPB52_008997 [Rhipicephalus sanguineus]